MRSMLKDFIRATYQFQRSKARTSGDEEEIHLSTNAQCSYILLFPLALFLI